MGSIDAAGDCDEIQAAAFSVIDAASPYFDLSDDDEVPSRVVSTTPTKCARRISRHCAANHQSSQYPAVPFTAANILQKANELNQDHVSSHKKRGEQRSHHVELQAIQPKVAALTSDSGEADIVTHTVHRIDRHSIASGQETKVKTLSADKQSVGMSRRTPASGTNTGIYGPTTKEGIKPRTSPRLRLPAISRAAVKYKVHEQEPHTSCLPQAPTDAEINREERLKRQMCRRMDK